MEVFKWIRSRNSNKTEYAILNYYLFLVSFKNIIGTTSLSDVNGVRWLTDLSGSFQKKEASTSCGFTIWSIIQTKKYRWGVRCSTFYCICDQQVSDWVDFLNSSVSKTSELILDRFKLKICFSTTKLICF